MTEPYKGKIKISRSNVQFSMVQHLTGGIWAEFVERDQWRIPLVSSKNGRLLHDLTQKQLNGFAKSFDLQRIAYEENVFVGRRPNWHWRPIGFLDVDGRHPGELWSAVSYHAEDVGDFQYARLARHISFSLAAAGSKLRDASTFFHSELEIAVEEKREPGVRFANLTVREIQIAFHSVLTELAGACDYLAALVASDLHAPQRLDSLVRLADWLSADARAELRQRHPIGILLLKAYVPEDGWLKRLFQHRKRVVHHEPLGSRDGARFLRFSERSHGDWRVPSIEMPLRWDQEDAPDALATFVIYYHKVCGLVAEAARHSKHSAAMPTLTDDDFVEDVSSGI